MCFASSESKAAETFSLTSQRRSYLMKGCKMRGTERYSWSQMLAKIRL